MYNSENNKYEGYIYCITNTMNGKQYIGQTVQTVTQRWRVHACAANRKYVDTYIDRAIAKYGVNNFAVETLYIVNSDTDEMMRFLLDIAEIFFINLYHSMYYDGGYNVSTGGQGYGLERKSCKNSVDVYDIKGKYLNTFSTMTEAAQYYKCDTKSVSDVCHGNVHNVFNLYIFRISGEEFNKYNTVQLKPAKRVVYVYDLEHNLIDVCDSVYRTTKKYHCSKYAVFNRCKHLTDKPYNKKYYFEFSELS